MTVPAARYSNPVQAVRAYYGLAHAPLAACLGVSEALLKLAATDRRELPATAYLRLQPLAAALPPPWSNGPAAPAPPVLPTPALWPAPPAPAPGPDLLDRRLLDLRHRLQALERAAASLHRRYAQGVALQGVLPAWEAVLPPADARVARWLPLLHGQVAERLGPAASAALALADARRLAVQVELAQLEAWRRAMG